MAMKILKNVVHCNMIPHLSLRKFRVHPIRNNILGTSVPLQGSYRSTEQAH